MRELKRVCEQLVLTSPLPIIRDVDIKKLLHYQSAEGSLSPFSSSFGMSLESFLTSQEKEFIEYTLKREPDIDAVSQKLKVSKSTLYKKIKDLGIVYE